MHVVPGISDTLTPVLGEVHRLVLVRVSEVRQRDQPVRRGGEEQTGRERARAEVSGRRGEEGEVGDIVRMGG